MKAKDLRIIRLICTLHLNSFDHKRDYKKNKNNYMDHDDAKALVSPDIWRHDK